MIYIKKTGLLLVFLITIYWLNAQANQKHPYKDPAVPVELRIKDLLGRMTLEEKLRQIDVWHPKVDLSKPEILKNTVAALGDTVKNGIGFLQFNVRMNYAEYLAQFNAIQKYFVEQTRLGIPVISNGEGCHGFVGNENKSTVFPVSALLGSTWDTTLIESVYGAVAKEMRSFGVTHAATPVIDLLRDPRFGRSDEMLGEDPYHVAMMGVGAIFGLQGRSTFIDKNHLIACAKHFSGHGQPEGGTNLAPANLSERILRENHFYPFEMAVKKANVRTVMASYNEIDGVPNHANYWLLNDVLRGEWGFTGYVISDYDAVNRMVYRQHASQNQREAGMRAINAGMDFECPGSWKDYCFRFLPELIKTGEVNISTIDSAVSRVLRNKFLMGLFEQPYIIPANENDIAKDRISHRKIALEAAEKGMILLKNNNNTLPFSDTKIKRLAIIGPNADEVHYGTYSNDSTPGISILEGMRTYGKGKFEVFYSEGFKIYENDTTLRSFDKTIEAENKRIQDAVALAKTCDAVLLVMGGNELTCREEWKNHTGDRFDLELLGRQNDLANAIFDLKKQTAVLLINGRPLSVNYLAEKAPAIIEGWYLGQEQGTAVANVIFGNVNPSGKLAVTIPRHVGQLPVYYNRKPYVHESPYITGAYSPLYPFGFGLSYTQYHYTNLSISTKNIGTGEGINVTIDVTNTGERDGDEIVQLYIHDLFSTVTRPVQELKDFARVHIKKGETKKVSFNITPDKLQYYGPDMKRIVEPGAFEVQIGKSSVEYLSDTFEVVKPKPVNDVNTKIAVAPNDPFADQDFKKKYKGKPWKNKPQQIPGKIECEWYDTGGKGIAYHGKDSINNGSGKLNPANGTILNEFRMKEGVDISYTKARDIDNSPFNLVEPLMDQFYTGWTEPGEWINYSINVTKTGNYNIGLMFTASGDGAISLLLDGKQLTKDLQVPSTRNEKETIPWRQWHHWNRIDKLATVELNKGRHLLTLKTTVNGNMNYDYLMFTLQK